MRDELKVFRIKDIISIVLVIALAVSLIGTNSVFASEMDKDSASVAATTGYYFNGGIRSIANRGACAVIETQNPYVSSGSSSSAWSMTCESNSVNRYAQVGYLKYSSYSVPKFFYEYSYGSSVWEQKTFSNVTVGTHHEYMVGCATVSLLFKINGVEYGRIAMSKIPFNRNKIEILTETHAVSDQSHGSAANPVTMGAVKYKDPDSENWISTKCYSDGILTGYGSLTTQRNNISYSGSSSWEVWDSRY